MSEEAQAIFYTLEVAHIEKYRTNGGTCTALASVAVDGNDVFSVCFQPFVHQLSNLAELVESRCVAVDPVEVSHSPLKVLLFVVSRPFRDIDYVIVICKSHVQKF